jgi:hypothetical protein
MPSFGPRYVLFWDMRNRQFKIVFGGWAWGDGTDNGWVVRDISSVVFIKLSLMHLPASTKPVLRMCTPAASSS